jgi:Holliday junction resolvase RusA-like endonuclease
MKNRFDICLPLPPPLNSLYRHHGHIVYMTREGKEWKDNAKWELIEEIEKQKVKPTTNKTVKMSIKLYLKRDRDIDGSLKILLDSLQGFLFINDSQVKYLEIEKFIDRENPRVEMIITW